MKAEEHGKTVVKREAPGPYSMYKVNVFKRRGVARTDGQPNLDIRKAADVVIQPRAVQQVRIV